MENLQKHFKEFYNKILFLDKNLGEEEKSFERDKYFTGYYDKSEDKGVSSAVYEENIKDDYILLRLNGLVLKLQYGAWYNKKYKELDVYISKDPYYNGDNVGSVRDILKLLEEYINTHYKEYSEKINKVIVGADKTKDIIVKYKNSNILTIDNIKVVTINDADISNKDIESLAKYKNLQRITFNKCNISADNFYLIKSWSMVIAKSVLEKLANLNNTHVGSLKIYSSKINEEPTRPLTLDVKDLGLDSLDIDLALFFLTTNFKNLIGLAIDGKILNPDEVNLLKVFYQVQEMELDGKSYSFDFLDDLTTLEQFRGYIELVSEYAYKRYKEKYESSFYDLGELDNREERLKNYIFYRNKDANLKRKKLLKDIRLSKVAQAKWEGKIKSATDEDVRNIYNLPWNQRKLLGREDEVKFIETNFKDPFNLLANTQNSLLSKIVGPMGERLVKPRRYGFFGETNEVYILGPDGKVLESVEYVREQDIKIPESIEEHKITLVKNDNNVLDYYYNRQVSEEEKVTYLSMPVVDYLYNQNDEEFIKCYERNQELLRRIAEINKKIDDIVLNDWNLLSSPRHKYEERITMFRGKEVNTIVTLPDDFIPEDNNLYHALERTRDVELIRYSLERIFDEEKMSAKRQEETWTHVYQLLDLWVELDGLEKEIQVSDEIVLKYFSKHFENILGDFEKENYLGWYLDDIDTFLSKYEIDENTREVLTKYILMRQSRYRADLEHELDCAVDRCFTINELYSVLSIFDWNKENEDDEDFARWFKDGKISKDEYDKLTEYFDLESVVADIREILDFDTGKRELAYQEMIPLIDNFSLDDLKKIKEDIVVASEHEDKFKKFVDYIYYYIHGKYPKWIELELAKCPKLEESYDSSITREVVPEHTLHLESSFKVNKRPYIN